MSMQGDGCRRIAGGGKLDPRGCLLSRAGRLMLCIALGLMAAGCASIGPTLAPAAPPVPARDLSIAFESIDGLPRDLSQRLARDLNEEAAALRIAVVPANGEAAYRLRGYLANRAQGGTVSIAWAWDVYDAELHRAFRLSGEERASAPAERDRAEGRNAGRNSEDRNWAVVDEAVLRAIARAGMAQLAGFMAAPPPSPATPQAPAPAPAGSEVVADRDLPPAADGSRQSLAVPLPQQRPALAALGTTRLADATSGH